MATIYNYRVYCVTDAKAEYIWAEEPPTACPTNTAHTIDSTKTSIVERREPNLQQIQEENIPTGGNFQCETKTINAGALETVIFEHTWVDYAVNVLAFYFVAKAEHEGDNIGLCVGPDTVIGAITQDVITNDTVIHVSQTVIDNTAVGENLVIDDGVNADDLGIVTAVDGVAKTVTVKTPAVNSFSAVSPTYVKQTHYIIPKDGEYEIGPAWGYTIGKSKIGSSYIPKNTTVRFTYTNNTAVAKKLIVKIEYLR